jgi:hypothetical protein
VVLDEYVQVSDARRNRKIPRLERSREFPIPVGLLVSPDLIRAARSENAPRGFGSFLIAQNRTRVPARSSMRHNRCSPIIGHVVEHLRAAVQNLEESLRIATLSSAFWHRSMIPFHKIGNRCVGAESVAEE